MAGILAFTISINRQKFFAILDSITVLFNEPNHKEQRISHDLHHAHVYY